jgi:hypothetical protein
LLLRDDFRLSTTATFFEGKEVANTVRGSQ